MVESISAVYDENSAILKRKQTKSKEQVIQGFKKYVILLSIIAATQDGLVKDKYEQPVKTAIKMGLTRKDVQVMIQLLRAEFKIAKQLKLYLNPFSKL